MTNLKPYTVYSFQVIAVNMMGSSQPSKESYYMVTLRESECDNYILLNKLQYESRKLDSQHQNELKIILKSVLTYRINTVLKLKNRRSRVNPVSMNFLCDTFLFVAYMLI